MSCRCDSRRATTSDSGRSPAAGTRHVCDTGFFDRTICPEPCGAMHSYCVICEQRQDDCAHDLLGDA